MDATSTYELYQKWEIQLKIIPCKFQFSLRNQTSDLITEVDVNKLKCNLRFLCNHECVRRSFELKTNQLIFIKFKM